MNNLIKCDSCNKYMQSNQIDIKDKQIKPGIQKKSWRCLHCNHEYIVTVTDKTTRRMMQDNKRDRERIKGIHNKSKLLRSAGKLSNEHAIKNAMDIEAIQIRIDKRIKDIEGLARKLKDEHKEAL